MRSEELKKREAMVRAAFERETNPIRKAAIFRNLETISHQVFQAKQEETWAEWDRNWETTFPEDMEYGAVIEPHETLDERWDRLEQIHLGEYDAN